MLLQREWWLIIKANNAPIGVFDSGIGGFTVYSHLAKLMPKENFIYFADNLNSPFGDKTIPQILAINDRIIKYFLSKKVKMIVIACNTSSALAIDHNSNKYDVPFVDMLNDGLRFAQELEEGTRVGIIATQATVNSESYLKILSKYNPKIKVFQQATPELVPLIESGDMEGVKAILPKYLEPYEIMDHLLYGCSHYPHIDETVHELYPNFKTIDPALYVATSAYKKLKKIGLSSANKGNVLCYTKEQPSLVKLAKKLGFTKFKLIKSKQSAKQSA